MMYSTEANASSAEGVKLMVSHTPVTIWLTSTSSAREPKKYRKLKFLGA